MIPLSVNWRKRQNAFTANTVTISSLERGRFDMPYGRDSTQRNLRKPENWANRRAPIRSKKIAHLGQNDPPHQYRLGTDCSPAGKVLQVTAVGAR